MSESRAILYFDGRCTGNGTPQALGAYGWVVLLDAEELATGKGRAGEGEDMTANMAEYVALMAGLRALLELEGIEAVEVRGDSQTVVRQMTGAFDCWASHLQPLREEALELVRQLQERGCSLSMRWIPREENERADRLSREAFDEIRRGASSEYAGAGDPAAATSARLSGE